MFSQTNPKFGVRNEPYSQNTRYKCTIPKKFIVDAPVQEAASLAYDLRGTDIYYSDGIKWIPLSKRLIEGTNITLTDVGTGILVDASGTNAITLLSSAGGSISLVNDGTGPDLAIKGLDSGNFNITMVDNGDRVTVSTVNGPRIAEWRIGSSDSFVSASGTSVLNTTVPAMFYLDADPVIYELGSDFNSIGILKDGWYKITFQVGAAISGTGVGIARAGIGMRKNGSNFTNLRWKCYSLVGPTDVNSTASTTDLASVGDEYRIYCIGDETYDVQFTETRLFMELIADITSL